MRKKLIILLAVYIIAIVTISLLAWNPSKPSMSYRNFNTPDEERALTVAETFDYLAIAPPLGRYGPTKFVNTETINYYQTRYDQQLKQIISLKKVALTYTANVTYLTQLRVFNSPGGNMTHNGEIIPWYNITVVFYNPDNSAILATDNHMVGHKHIFYRNQSEYQALQPEFDLNFSDCYLVEMKLDYTETLRGTPRGEYTEIRQIVVLNQNLVPVLIGINYALVFAD
ncbi:MAG: hypothetical protein FWF66_01715 [Candidatus Bathyarchaeota archaeon]|nr:hypothetical protein [Candidatus Termiticorpusculum sp.]